MGLILHPPEIKNQAAQVRKYLCSRGETHITNYCFTVPAEPDRHLYGPRNWKEREDAWKVLEKQINK